MTFGPDKEVCSMTLHAILLEVRLQNLDLESRLPTVHATITKIYGVAVFDLWRLPTLVHQILSCGSSAHQMNKPHMAAS